MVGDRDDDGRLRSSLYAWNKFLSKNSKLKHTQGQTLKMELGGAKWKLLEETFNILGGEIKNHKNFSGKK